MENESHNLNLQSTLFSGYFDLKYLQKRVRNSGLVPDEDVATITYKINSICQKIWFPPQGIPDQLIENANIFLEKYYRCEEENSTLIFVVLYPGSFPSIEYLVSSLRDHTKYRVAALYIFSEPPANVFDIAFGCQNSLALLFYLLEKISPKKLYLQAHARWCFLGFLLKSMFPASAIIQEVYDWMEAFIGDEELAASEGVFSHDLFKVILFSEAFTRTNIDGLVFKDQGIWIREKLKNSAVPSLRLNPSPPAEWMQPVKKDMSTRKKGSTFRLVFAGKIAPSSASTHFLGDIQLLSLFKELTMQGLFVTAYNSPIYSDKETRELFQDYICESEHNNLFQYHNGIKNRLLIKEIAGKYDFGILLYRFNNDLAVGEAHLSGSIASKLFTYIAAGLPILVSERLKAMANLVEKHGIGLVISDADLKNMDEKFISINYSDLLINVVATQKLFCMENELPKIIDFIESISQ